MVLMRQEWQQAQQWVSRMPSMRLMMICIYQRIYFLLYWPILPHFLDKFLARRLLFRTGMRARATQWEVELERTTKTARIAERELEARFLTVIVLKYYFFILLSILFKVMAQQAPKVEAPKPEGEKRGFGRGGDKKGGKRPQRKKEEVEWRPVTKLGRLVKHGLIDNIVDIFRFSIPIKEQEIVDKFLAGSLKEEVMEVKSVQKQTQAGQRTRFKAYAIVGDEKNYIGLGWKCHKEVQGAIKGAVTMAKLNIIPVRKGYWGNKLGATHTIPCKVTGKSGSVKVRLVPAPRGTGLVAPPVTKKLFNFAGIHDIYTKTEGSTRTRGNFVKAGFAAIKAAFEYNAPDFWGKSVVVEHPFVIHRVFLENEKVKA